MLKLRWGIVGCGNVTEIKSGPAYQLTEGFELHSVMRRDIEKLKDYAQRHNVPKYTTAADELINDPEIDAVYIATPPDSHMEYALKVAKAGKPCVIEKPLAPSYKDCQIITNAFKEIELPLFVAYYRRSLPRFNQVKEWLDTGKIGTIRHITWQFSKPANEMDLSKKYNWRTNASIARGGYFDDLASHGLDLFSMLLGEVKEAKGIATNQQGLYTAKDSITASWIYVNGVTGTGHWNFGSHVREDVVSIYGSEGKITFSVFGEVPLVLETKDNREEIFIENPPNIQLYHAKNIKKELIDGNFKHPSTGESATHTAWVMDKILGVI